MFEIGRYCLFVEDEFSRSLCDQWKLSAHTEETGWMHNIHARECELSFCVCFTRMTWLGEVIYFSRVSFPNNILRCPDLLCILSISHAASMQGITSVLGKVSTIPVPCSESYQRSCNTSVSDHNPESPAASCGCDPRAGTRRGGLGQHILFALWKVS